MDGREARDITRNEGGKSGGCVIALGVPVFAALSALCALVVGGKR